MDATISKRIQDHFDREEWSKARDVILSALKKQGESHWLLTRLATTYYEERKYEKALAISKKALRRAPNCPLVLWDYAGCLDMKGRHMEAIKIWQKLLRRGLKKIAYDECGEGIRWAKSLLNDCRYSIAKCYWHLGRLSLAIKHFKKHFENRSPGTPSIYKLSSVRKEYSQLQKHREGKGTG